MKDLKCCSAAAAVTCALPESRSLFSFTHQREGYATVCYRSNTSRRWASLARVRDTLYTFAWRTLSRTACHLHYSASALLGAFYEWGKKKSWDVFFSTFWRNWRRKEVLNLQKTFIFYSVIVYLMKDKNYLAIVYFNWIKLV